MDGVADRISAMRKFVFPRWADRAKALAGLALGIGPVYALALAYYGGAPTTTDVGYMPEQPVPYSHALHAGELGIDCRYCHNTVEQAARAAVPTTESCMNCHATIWTKSAKLLRVRESMASGNPVPWVRVHDLADFVYFDHSAHVTRGVGCVSCHGQVNEMAEVTQVHTLSMGWCLDCHRAPEPHLRPPSEVTNMKWRAPEDPAAYGRKLREQYGINPPTDCSTCHR